jgi:hypothetical protein
MQGNICRKDASVSTSEALRLHMPTEVRGKEPRKLHWSREKFAGTRYVRVSFWRKITGNTGLTCRTEMLPPWGCLVLLHTPKLPSIGVLCCTP